MKRKRLKFKEKNLLVLILILICIILLIVSSFNIINWVIDSNKIKKETNEIKNLVEVKETIDNDNVEIIKQEEKINEENPYWDYIKMNLINVDFRKLKEINNDTKGWIKVNGTNINYPFVQSSNNSFYLTHSYDKSYNKAGWVFIDYRNNINELSKNTILYAHGRTDNTMFGSLRNILKSKWFNDTNNYVVKLSTEKENTLWQVFSVYRIPTNNDYIQVNFNSNDEFENWVNILINRSNHNFNTSVSKNDKILTLSTCYNDSDKVVLHAKLIKKEVR